MSKKVLVVGGGIIGLSTAYYLQQDGHQVTVLDKSGMDSGASYVNAGYLTPSHIIPLAAPGMMAQGIKYMFNNSSPFYMKPRLDWDFIKWSWHFNKSAIQANVERAIPLIRDINLLSKELYTALWDSKDLGEFQLEKKGLLMLYKSEAEGLHEKEVAGRAAAEGLEVALLDRTQLDQLQPDLVSDIKGAVHYECDAHTTPDQLMGKLKDFLTQAGVTIKKEEAVVDFSLNGNRISGISTNKGAYAADEVILAAGSWSFPLAKKLGLNIPIQAGKGYRINLNRPTAVKIPAILMDAKVAVTPMAGFTRFAGTMELSGINHNIIRKRVESIAKAASAYYQDLSITEAEIDAAQCGLRPVSPDGLPYIGRTHKFKNLTVASGHAMMGWSLGPASGKLVSELIAEKKPSMALEGFSPDRKF